MDDNVVALRDLHANTSRLKGRWNMENEYLDLLRDIFDTGYTKMDRTGTGTIGVFGRQIRCDLAHGFPLLTTKDINWKSVAHELIWFLAGDTNIRYLCQNGVNIWVDWPHKYYLQCWDNPKSKLRTAPHLERYTRKEFIQKIIDDEIFAKMWGDCGPIYSQQWRKWDAGMEFTEDKNGKDDWGKFEPNAPRIERRDRDEYFGYWRTKYIDQIQQLVDGLKNNPLSRRHIVNAWNPADIEEMAISGLPPCHFVFQCNARPLSDHDRDEYIRNGFVAEGQWQYALDLHINIRSNDMGLGAPYNIASYAMLIHMLAQQVNMVPGELVYTVGDAHIYLNHVDKLREQLTRSIKLPPLLKLRKADSIFDYTIADFDVVGYDPHPAIKMDVAV